MEQKQKQGVIRRVAVGTFKAWSYSVGVTSLGRTLGRIGGNIGNAVGQLRRRTTYRNETFEEAVARLGLSEADLVQRARVANVWAFSWLAAMTLAAVRLSFVAWSDAPMQHAALCLGVMFVAFSKTMTWRFRYSQIRDHELYGFGSWLRSPGRW